MKLRVLNEAGEEIWVRDRPGPPPPAIVFPVLMKGGVGERTYQRVAVNDDDGAVYA